MNMRLVSLRAIDKGAVAAEFMLEGQAATLATTFTVNNGDITTASATPDILQEFRGTAEELRAIVGAVVAFSRVASCAHRTTG